MGEVGETAGTKTCIVGVAESATVVFVNPQMVSLSLRQGGYIMANLIEVTDTTKIKPLDGARRPTLHRRRGRGGGLSGVPQQSSGAIVTASGSTAAANRVIGVALHTLATGDRGDVVVKGPMYCLTGATPGGLLQNDEQRRGHGSHGRHQKDGRWGCRNGRDSIRQAAHERPELTGVTTWLRDLVILPRS